MAEENLSRRRIIISVAIVPVAAIRAAVQAPSTALSAAQLRTLDAFVDRLIPKDENGPGASECGAANYIDRSLADYLAPEKPVFLENLAALDAWSRAKHDAAFADLSPEKRDEVVTTIENGTATVFKPNARAFFARIRLLTLEGTFGDPYYGGNEGFAGWDLIGYPGPRLAVSEDDQRMKISIKPSHVSSWGGVRNGH